MNKHYEAEEHELGSEILEKMFLDEYFIIVRRIPGISLSIKEFWETDSKQINYILDKELEIIEVEENERKKHELEIQSTSRTGKMIPNKYDNDEGMEEALQSYFM